MFFSPLNKPSFQAKGRLLPILLSLLGAFCILLSATPSQALLRLDFEQKFYSHKDHQVWDFSMVRADSVYHFFYCSVLESDSHASKADTLWHGTSTDLKHWTLEGPILVVGQGVWDEGAMWAPDVFFDEASGLWKIAYTGCDMQMNQRICFAESPDLYNWTKLAENPILEPDPDEYIWSPSSTWSDFRDPFIFRQNDQWHILVTAQKMLTEATGVLFHGVSDDLLNWTDVGTFYENDGDDPWRVPESPQFKIVDDYHYLFFGEFDTQGLSMISSRNSNNWTMDNRVFFDYGYAPEVDEFDPGHHIISRLANYVHPQTQVMSYSVRLDTLRFNPDGSITVMKPPPLGDNWASWSGITSLANPTFGDNPAFRGEESVGLVGNSYYGSAEYYQGPLSGRGAPGIDIGASAMGSLTSFPFIATGDRLELLVGGGNYPETCYVALVDADTDEIIYKETGNNQNLMTLRSWDLQPYQGQTLFISIIDDENGEMGYINVDEIIEVIDSISSVQGPDLRQEITLHHASPNPFNPMTRICFTLNRDLPVQVRIHDIRGHEIWSSGNLQATTGENSVTWQGLDHHGQPAPTGTYLYSIETRGTIVASGKLSLVK